MGLSRGVKGCIGKSLAVELLMKCHGCRFFGMAVWWRYLLNSYVDSPCVNNKIAINEELDAYLCTSSQLSGELRLYDIYAERVFKSS